MSKRRRATRGRDASQHLLRKRAQQALDADDLDDESFDAWSQPDSPPSSPTASASADATGETPEAPVPAHARPGRVAAIASGQCWVIDGDAFASASSTAQDGDGANPLLSATSHGTPCALPSRLAADQRATLAVGDAVDYAPIEGAAADGATGHQLQHRVHRVHPRRTELSRPDPHNPRQRRLIATNVDWIVHVASVGTPPLRPALIDRYLIAIAQSGAQALIAVNKIDLLSPDETPALDDLLATYAELGHPVLRCSAARGIGIDALRARLRGTTAAFVGHSGVGKSSLLNALSPQLDIRTGAVSEVYARGRHTTTRAGLFHLADAAITVIDTPGIREMGLWQLRPDALAHSFDDLAALAVDCRFPNCTHVHEPGCAVRAAVDAGTLSARRYAIYRRILDSLQNAS
ncbi:MAG: ribosome small subunit-dependent GTPase A [Acidobacteriota bacterium]